MKLLALCTLLGAFSALSAQEWRLIWEDNFDFLDMTKWQHEVTAWGGGNGEFQVYTNDPANSYTENGNLVIKPTRTMDNINPLTGEVFGEDYLYNGVMDLEAMYGACTMGENFGCYREGVNGILPSVMSARLRTFERFSFQYGRAEVRARMPEGDWMWPAIWLLPEDWVYGGWPLSGEIDMQECRGNPDLKVDGDVDIGIQEAASTLHWGLAPDQNKYILTNEVTRNYTHDYANSFHDYFLEWSAEGMEAGVDGQVLLRIPHPSVPNWTGFYDYGAPWAPGTPNVWDGTGADPLMTPFDREFHFILNIAVGGTNGFFPDTAVNRGGAEPKPWQNFAGNQPQDFWDGQNVWYNTWGDNASMEVDYIRVYEAV